MIINFIWLSYNFFVLFLFLEMTKIHRFLEEVLNKILKELEPDDLEECQHVCSAWYSPTHVKFLNNVEIDNIVKKRETGEGV